MMTRRHFRLFVFYPFAALTGLTVATWLAAPFVAEHYLTRYFQDQGQDLTLDKLSIDFFPPKIDVKNLTINDKTQDTLTLKRAIVEVEIWPLFTKTLHLSDAKIEGLDLDIAQQGKDWLVAGINTSQFLTPEDQQENQTKEENSTANASSPWSITLPSFSFTDSQVTLSRQADMDTPKETDTFVLTNLSIQDLSGQEQTWQGKFDLTAQVNESALSLSSQFDYSPIDASANVTIKETHLLVESFQHFLPAPYRQGTGQVDLEGNFQFLQQQVNGTPVFDLKNLLIKTQVSHLDLPLAEEDKVTTKSTSLVLSDATLHFASAEQLSATGTINLQSTQSSVVTGEQSAQFDDVTLKAPFDIQQDTTSGLSANMATTELAMSAFSLSSDSLAVQNKQLDISLKDVIFNLDSQQALTASLLANIKSHHLSVQQAGNTANYDEFNLANTFSLQKNGDDLTAKNSQLSIDIKGLNANQDNEKQFSLGALTLTAESIDFDQQNQQPPVTKGTNINITTESLDSLLTDTKRIAAWQNANINGLSFTQQDKNFATSLDELRVADLTISEPLAEKDSKQTLPPLTHIGSIKVEQLKATQDGANIHQITADSTKVSLILDQQKRIENLVFVDVEQQASPEPVLKNPNVPREKDANNAISNTTNAEQNPAFKAPYYVILDTYDTTGKSSVYVLDKSISPTLQRTLDINTLSLRNLNTQNKDQATVLALKARNGKYATLNSDITIWPLADKLTMKSDLVIREAELPPYSSYIASVLGYQIDSGQLDLDLTLNADDGVLNGNSHIVLREFDLGGRKESSSVIKAGAVPLNIAVGILKDRDNNIDLDIPLSGDIENPEFGWQDFLLLPVRKALYSASSTYLMQTFVPYANVISIAQFAGDQLLKIRVEPLIFEAEDDALNDSQEAFLKQLVALMKDKKDSQLKACGVASYLDLGLEKPPASIDAPTRDTARELAQKRADHLKDYLVKEGISSSRVFLCSPEVDLSKNSQPRVELNF